MYRVKLFMIVFMCIISLKLTASNIDFSKNSENILLDSEIYIDKENLTLQQLKNDVNFLKSNTSYINLGFVRDTTVWVKLCFYNNTNKKLTKILEIRNPLLQSVFLYGNKEVKKKGTLYLDNKKKRYINTIFKLSLDSKEFKTYYLKVQNKTTSLKFGLFLKEEVVFLYDEYTKRSLMDVFFTIIIMLLMYNLTLLFYTKNKTYFLYAFYLATLISQQATYLGLTQLYMPSWFVYYDDLSVVFKVNMVFIAAAFFAKSFLETKNYPKINTIYNIIISAGFLEIFLLGMPSFYYPEIGIVTAFSFVIFNMYAGFYVYISGYKQARFFVVGWSFLVIGFIVMIFDSLGIITVMHKVSNIIMFLTAFEAVVLSLAFLDRYMILKQEKEQINKILLNTLNEKQIEIELQINKKTKDLCDALENKKILLKELQHRTKNNLQLILSLIRMQSDGSSEGVKHKFKNLEGRISAIAKSHQLLYLKDDLQKINMDEYINELCNDLENLSEKELIIDIQARQIYMPLREASYIGLIINELITNSIKYVNLTNIIISIDMLKNGAKYLLIVKDNGNGFEYDKLSSEGIGLKLVQILVESQLGGNLEIQIKDGCRYMIEFQL